MKREDRAVEEAYLAAAQGWETDRVTIANASAKRAWQVAYGSMAVAAVAVLGLSTLFPLKTIETVAVRVNDNTGVVDVVPKYEGDAALPEVAVRNQLQHYVSARERFAGFASGLVEVDYETVAAYQAPKLNSGWATLWNRANPQSPLNLYKDGTTKRVRVNAITFLKLDSGRQNVAQVRFTVITRPTGSGQDQVVNYLSTVEYAFTKPSDNNRVRALNPLGFRVVEYSRDVDMGSDGPAARPPVAAAVRAGAAPAPLAEGPATRSAP